MKIDNNIPVAPFDFKVTVAPDNTTAGSGRQGSTDIVPSVIDRPAALLDINASITTRDPDFERQPVNTDPAAENRRRIARAMIGRDVDVQAMTPREASDVGLQLYAEGLVTWDEYAEFAFQPELHPSYNETIGALLGERASPDQPRDFVSAWRDRLAYEQRYNAIDSPQVKSSQRITAILARLADQSTNLDA